jgi:hypothetical protein
MNAPTKSRTTTSSNLTTDKRNKETNSTPVQGFSDDDLSSLKGVIIQKKSPASKEEDYELELKQSIQSSSSYRRAGGNEDRKSRQRRTNKENASLSTHEKGDDYFDLYVNREYFYDSKISGITLQDDIIPDSPIRHLETNAQPEMTHIVDETNSNSLDNLYDLLLLSQEKDSVHSEVTFENWKSYNDPYLMSACNSFMSENSLDAIESSASAKNDCYLP